MPKKDATNEAWRLSVERAFNQTVNAATKSVDVAIVDAGSIVDFTTTAPHMIANCIADAVPRRQKDVRRKLHMNNIACIRRDIKDFLRSLQGMTYTQDALLNMFRDLRKKHEDKLILVPTPDYSKSYFKRFKHIKVSREQKTEWNRAIKARRNHANDVLDTAKEMEEFGKLAASLTANGTPVEIGSI